MYLAYLAYIDDSAVTDKRREHAVFAAVIVKDSEFKFLEGMSTNVKIWFADEMGIKAIDEFNAHNLFRGEGIFESIEEKKRFDCIQYLFEVVMDMAEMSVIYGSVNRTALDCMDIASVNPADVSFRKCVAGIDWWVASLSINNDGSIGQDELCILIMDDTADVQLKKMLRQSYRALTRSPNPRQAAKSRLEHLHDDLYFGDSVDSVGLQCADACAYFIGLHLNEDQAGEHFYKMFEEKIKYSEVYPTGRPSPGA